MRASAYLQGEARDITRTSLIQIPFLVPARPGYAGICFERLHVKYGYYPGCTLKKNAASFEKSALHVMKAAGIEFREMKVWNCCGTSFGLTKDMLIHQIAPVRNILRARQEGFDAIVTLCSICYNTLKRADSFISSDSMVKRRITGFLDEYGPYEGGFPVFHLLEVLEDRIGLGAVSKLAIRPLSGLRAAAYYGCMLVRPAELGFDSMERPGRLRRFLKALGAEPVDFPLSTECCGAYHAVGEPATAAEFSRKIIDDARLRGAEIIVTGCPLCHHNLDRGQAEIIRAWPGFNPMPVMYFTQAAALAFGEPAAGLGFESNFAPPQVLLDRLAGAAAGREAPR